MTPDERIRAAYAALRARGWQGALGLLDGLALPERAGAEARIWGFRAQALEGLGRVPEAERAAAEGVRWARRAEDPAGVKALRELQARLLQSLAAALAVAREREADGVLADTPDEDLERRGETEPGGRAALLLRKANVLIDLGRVDEARTVIHRAMVHARLADEPRELVFAHLCLARAFPAEAEGEVRAAQATADRVGDQGLVSAVARAAAVIGLRFTSEAVPAEGGR